MESDYDINCPACAYGAAYQKHNCREKGSASAYTFDNYQEDAGTTAIYPGSDTSSPEAINYCILGLIGEAGEIANKWKKFLRDSKQHPDDLTSYTEEIANELGDVLWYCARLSAEIDDDLSDIAAANIRKLNDRKQRGVIRGSGDER